MANEYALSYSPAPSDARVQPGLVAALSFLVLLLLIYVRLDAFSPPPAVAQFGGVQEASRGDVLRQILYLGIAGLIGMVAMARHGFAAIRIIPVSMILLLAWCLVSALWAPRMGVVVRRAGLEVVIVISLLLSVETLGAVRAFKIWRWLLAAVLLVNFVSIPLVESARHGAGEIDPALVGNWRGLYGHKNIAGGVCAITAILFLFTSNGRRNWMGIAIAAASCVFLAFTHSKSSAGFLAIALAAGLAYHLAWKEGLSRAILTVTAALLLTGLVVFAILDAEAIARILQDPAEFTGRSAIWAAELAYIADHPLLGSGFGTFTDAGAQSPLHNYVSGSWVDAVSHGHNGYLQVLVTIGGIGFLLSMVALVLAPARRLWTLDRRGSSLKPMLMALFVFALLHNFMESDFLEGDGVSWSALLLVIAALNSMNRPLEAKS